MAIDSRKKVWSSAVKRSFAPAILLFSLGLFCPQLVFSAERIDDYSFPGLIANGGYLIQTEKSTIAYREREQFIPASTLKLATSLAAIELLGPAFRFETHLYFDKGYNLYVKGYGDPYLTSEEVLRLALQLKNKGIKRINNLYLDAEAFKLEHETPGSEASHNPYDASNSALAVNFNSLSIKKLADGGIVSGEPQTPTLPLMEAVEIAIGRGKQRVNIDTAISSSKRQPSLQYAGELFVAQLSKSGIRVNGRIGEKVVPGGLTPLLRYKNSKTLLEMLRDCLHFSNNFIANQIYLYCGAKIHGWPATWNKSKDFMEQYLQQSIGLSVGEFSIHDGSGLSRKNRLSSYGLVKILEKFSPYIDLLNKHHESFLKSGTLDGVYCYAGYTFQNGRSLPFALLLNQEKNTRDALLRTLTQNAFP